jgi:hypothetical protein
MNLSKALLRMIVLAVATTLAAGEMNALPTNETNSVQAPDGETKRSIQDYFRWNGISTSAVLRVGMKLGDFVKVLGEPTRRYQIKNQHAVDVTPEGQDEYWVKWYHNPRNAHVAPVIRARIEKGIVKELQADRG